jgi:hypothetical protein
VGASSFVVALASFTGGTYFLKGSRPPLRACFAGASGFVASWALTSTADAVMVVAAMTRAKLSLIMRS